MVVARSWRGERNGELPFNKHEVSVHTRMNSRSAVQQCVWSLPSSMGHLQFCDEGRSPAKCPHNTRAITVIITVSSQEILVSREG